MYIYDVWFALVWLFFLEKNRYEQRALQVTDF